MPSVERIPVANLRLDLKNFRHMPENSEERALHAMVSLRTAYFWGLARGLLQVGYIPVENIVVLKSTPTDKKPIVKEGNRRIAIMKLALGFLKGRDLEIPDDINRLLKDLSPEWRKNNLEVPCLVFDPSEEEGADQIVDVTHGKGEHASRLDWTAVARARHNRVRNGDAEPALDLLEEYIRRATNSSADEKERWAADYPLTILVNALKIVAPRLGFNNQNELAVAYPKVPRCTALDQIVADIGRDALSTDDVRAPDFGVSHGIPLPDPPAPPTAPTPGVPGTPRAPGTTPGAPASPAPAASPASNPAAPVLAPAARQKRKAVPINSQASVRRQLKRFEIRGDHRDKIVTLRDEALTLTLWRQPHSFCFLLRSMFELSAKAYCEDNKKAGLITVQANSGQDRPLLDVLNDIYQHMKKVQTANSGNGKPNQQWVRSLHGAMVELRRPDSLFSVTSMNRLIHSDTFCVTESHICTVFSNVFPMLQEMNR